jgi:hypothetical protein
MSATEMAGLTVQHNDAGQRRRNDPAECGTPTIMKYPRISLLGVTALGAALVVSSASFAQEPPAGAPPAPGAMREHWAQHMQERAEARARALHDVLGVRPDQEGAFQAFVASMRPPERQEGAGRGMDHQATAEQLTTPERLDRMAARMAKHQADFQRKADAVRRFYAVLSPEQRRAFDALHGLMGGERHGPGDHGRFAKGGDAQGGA